MGADRYKRRAGSGQPSGTDLQSGTEVRGPLTGIREPVYDTWLPWQTQYLGKVAAGLRSEGAARRGSIVLLTFFALPFVVIAIAAVIDAVR